MKVFDASVCGSEHSIMIYYFSKLMQVRIGYCFFVGIQPISLTHFNTLAKNVSKNLLKFCPKLKMLIRFGVGGGGVGGGGKTKDKLSCN